MQLKKYTFFLIIIICILNLNIYAQCAMCKANAESSFANGSQDANWLNYGIIVMMIFPFLFMAFVYLIYKYNNNKRLN